MSVNITESVNIEVLKERVPAELVNPFGQVVVIPSRMFQRGWEPILESQGHRVFVGNYEGEAAFLVRVDKAKPRNVESKPLNPSKADTSVNSAFNKEVPVPRPHKQRDLYKIKKLKISSKNLTNVVSGFREAAA